MNKCPVEGVEDKSVGLLLFLLFVLSLFPQVFLSPFTSLHLALWPMALFFAGVALSPSHKPWPPAPPPAF